MISIVTVMLYDGFASASKFCMKIQILEMRCALMLDNRMQ
jgi:hypothetical protein